MSTNVAMLADVPLFQLIDDQERATLAELMTMCAFERGETIFEEGQPGESLYLIHTGRVQVFCHSDSGEKIILGDNENGDVFGEISLLDGGPRTASAVAVEPTQTLTINREKLYQLVQRQPHVAIDLLTVMGRRLRSTDELLRSHVTRNPNVEEEERLTFGERIADKVATFGGSWTFIITFGVVLLLWIAVHSILLAGHPFDPYPYILLNLFLSMLAALQAPVIMMSQNRQASKDRLKADLDYEVNMKAELEVAQLHRKIDRLSETLQSYAAKAGK
jgi:CRP/FNR family transcriptional regulator, cyclic AMP receptor protein